MTTMRSVVLAMATGGRRSCGCRLAWLPSDRPHIGACRRLHSINQIVTGILQKTFDAEVTAGDDADGASDNAYRVVSAPSVVSDEQTTTGIGCSAINWPRKVMPSIRGISMSSVLTSGQSRAFCRWQKSGPMPCR